MGKLNSKTMNKFITNLTLENLLTDLIITHSKSDFCLLGAKGSGKSTIIQEFKNRLGYSMETVILYQVLN